MRKRMRKRLGQSSSETSAYSGRIKLIEAVIGEKYIVEGIDKDDPSILRKLCSMGILPGVEVIVRRKQPTIIFEVYHSRFAVDKLIGDKIYVKQLHSHS
ncbi:FeoA family protein [Flexistipes sp.]|uniref:FeoA family protein n=1 Tax=Flexistipes sp. TaxID=3088135 RepID=UPI002E20D249|nr:FeoA family protein [Flexistipes sp.]